MHLFNIFKNQLIVYIFDSLILYFISFGWVFDSRGALVFVKNHSGLKRKKHIKNHMSFFLSYKIKKNKSVIIKYLDYFLFGGDLKKGWIDKNGFSFNELCFLIENKNVYFCDLMKNENFVNDHLDIIEKMIHSGIFSKYNETRLLEFYFFFLKDYKKVIDINNRRNIYFYLSSLKENGFNSFDFKGLRHVDDTTELIIILRKNIITYGISKPVFSLLLNEFLCEINRKIKLNKFEERELFLFKIQIVVSYGNETSLYLITKNIEKVNVRSILPAFYHMMVLCNAEKNNKSLIDDYFSSIAIKYMNNELKFNFIRFLAYLSSLMSKDNICRLVKENSIKISKIIVDSDNINLGMTMRLLFQNSIDALKMGDELARYGEQNFFSTTNVNAVKKLHYFPIKTILYQYIFSMQYHTFDKSDYVICESRFLELFKFNFPNCNFIPLERPNIHPNLSMKDAGLDAIRWYLPSQVDPREFNCIPLSIDVNKYEFQRNNGWLKTRKIQLDVIDSKKINVGISVGTGRKSKHRDMYSMEYQDINDIFSEMENINLINLDYHYDPKTLDEYNIKNPDIDLKNDIEAYISLMSQLDFMVIIPNSNMDAASSVGAKAFVFDPYQRGSYWLYSEHSNSYVVGDNVIFVSGNSYDSTYKKLEYLIKNEINRYKNEKYYVI